MAKPHPTTLKPVYSVAEVAALLGLNPGQTLRRLKAAGVVTSRGRGAKVDVLLSDLRAGLPEHWASILEAARLSAP